MLQWISEPRSFLGPHSTLLYVYTTFCLSFHLSTDVWTAATFQLLWVMLLRTWAYKYLVKSLPFGPFGYISRSGIAGPCGNSIFSFLRKHHSVFHSHCIILHSHWQCSRVPISPRHCQHLLFPISFRVAILMRVRWYLIIVLTHISLRISDFWAWFHVLVGHSYVFFWEMSTEVLCPFESQVVCFFVTEF